jgi:ABC-type sugar transport system permease subunit
MQTARATSPARRRPLLRWSPHQRRNMFGLLFVLPSVAFFGLFNIYPMVRAFYISLTSYSLLTPPEFIGLKNYSYLWQDDRFHTAMLNTFLFMIGTTAPMWVLALGLALVMARRFRFKEVYRTLYFMPVILSGVVVSIVWSLLYQENGLINAALSPFVPGTIYWLTSERLAPWSIIIMAVWQSLGFYMVIFLAGLQNIPADLYAAASIDGANAWARFRYVTLPLLKPTALFVTVISLIGGFQTFTYQYVMTRGGPGDATNVIALHIYTAAFSYLRIGLASAMSLIMFAIIMLLTLVQFRVLRTDNISYV